ncbi:fungal-specific transcription factor domain-containing protein [Aspergillus heterothallicus]
MSSHATVPATLQLSSNKPDRVRRACDRCNTSRTRCSGGTPWSPMDAFLSDSQPLTRLELNYSCEYQRTAKKRGPKPKSSRQKLEGISSLNNCYQTPFSSRPLSYGRFPIDLSPLDINCASKTKVSCRYPCLEPILQLLKGTLAPEDACDLLDVFFANADTTGPRTGQCPYVLSPVIRRKSLLSPSNPRPVSPALLAIILWCVSHTADHEIFQDCTARSRITQRLYFVSMQLLKIRDGDSWHRVSDSDILNGQEPVLAYSEKPEPDVDDVISFVLLACVISGSEFKEECHKWWNKAVLLVKELGFNSETFITQHTPSSQQLSLAAREEHEERRRAFWLVYALDRHLALCFNKPMCIHDSECQVLNPLPEWAWQHLDIIPLEDLPPRICGPSTHITGSGFFEYFLPLMVILGDIIEVRSRADHQRLGNLDDSQIVASIEAELTNYEYDIEMLRLIRKSPETTLHPELSLSVPASPSSFGTSSSCVDLNDFPRNFLSDEDQIELVTVYCQYTIRVLHILLYFKRDPVSLLNDKSGWLASPEFLACTSNSLTAVEILGRILSMDTQMSFAPFLFSIYLFHASVPLLVLADHMTQTGMDPSIKQACEVVIPALESSAIISHTGIQVRTHYLD